MRDRQTRAAGRQPRRCLHHGHVDRVRALRAAKDQNLVRRQRSAARVRSMSAVAKNSGRTGLPLTNPFLPKNATVDSNVTAAAPHDPREQPVGQPGHRVLLEQHRRVRRAAPRASTTGPELYPPTPITSDAAVGARRCATRRAPLSGSSATPRARVQRSTCPSSPRCESGRARSPRAARPAPRCPRAVPANVMTRVGPPREQLARDRDPRIQVAAGAAAGDHDAQAASCISRSPGSSAVVTTCVSRSRAATRSAGRPCRAG